jgi:hypothetical protein
MIFKESMPTEDLKKRKKVSMPPLPLSLTAIDRLENQENNMLLCNKKTLPSPSPRQQIFSSNNLGNTLKSRSTSSKASKRYDCANDDEVHCDKHPAVKKPIQRAAL